MGTAWRKCLSKCEMFGGKQTSRTLCLKETEQGGKMEFNGSNTELERGGYPPV